MGLMSLFVFDKVICRRLIEINWISSDTTGERLFPTLSMVLNGRRYMNKSFIDDI